MIERGKEHLKSYYVYIFCFDLLDLKKYAVVFGVLISFSLLITSQPDTFKVNIKGPGMWSLTKK